MSTLPRDKLLLRLLTVMPAMEKIFSDGTEIAGTQNSLRGSLVTIRKCSFLSTTPKHHLLAATVAR